ncbi:n-acetyltransferase domain-containing protein [Trichonephila clavata]|uniref:N-acetyltransferase domain-containing protein n=1 Tax=Trichonephila clavata TaxID=2740835 RepID=A0A8X6IJS2_TRICU|nr:n-acetyltransferase domain-containing protein [Trichonephila clavata]
MHRIKPFTVDIICNATRMLMNKSTNGTRQMHRTLSIMQQQNKNQILAKKEKFCFTMRDASEDDIPSIMETRKSIGVHEVPTVVQTAMKQFPQGIKIAEAEDGNIIGTASVIYVGDDEKGIYFGGLFFVNPKYRGSGVGIKEAVTILFRAPVLRIPVLFRAPVLRIPVVFRAPVLRIPVLFRAPVLRIPVVFRAPVLRIPVSFGFQCSGFQFRFGLHSRSGPAVSSSGFLSGTVSLLCVFIYSPA